MKSRNLFVTVLLAFSCVAQAQSDLERFEGRASAATVNEGRQAVAEGQRVFARVLAAYSAKIGRAHYSTVKKVTCPAYQATVAGYSAAGAFKVQPYDVCVYGLANGTLCKHDIQGANGWSVFTCVSANNQRTRLEIQVTEREMLRMNPQELYFNVEAVKR
jgi:hypothetical protein